MPKRILLIDDDRMVIATLARLLRAEGFEVMTANSGEEALKIVHAQDFQLIITDIRMPGQNGVELVTKIRELLKSVGKEMIPEIFITGYAEGPSHDTAKQMENVLIYKPFDKEPFLNAVKMSMRG